MIINCKEISENIRFEIKSKIETIKKDHEGLIPDLAVILVGNNPASVSYVKGKEKACEDVGIYSTMINLPEDTSENELISVIKSLNNDKDVNGILVQLPLPKHINTSKILNTIAPEKDVDCFTDVNVGKMIHGKANFLPCTPAGILEIIKNLKLDLSGKNVLVIGRSDIVGRPIANMLSMKPYDATVTIANSKTPKSELINAMSHSDLIISAVGKAFFLKKDDFIDQYTDYTNYPVLKENTTIIDVGVNRIEDPNTKNGFRLVGDIYNSKDTELLDYFERNSINITPIPGGVGPMTITMLLVNTLQAFLIQNNFSTIND